MKTISSALKAHLAQTVTTLTTCWQIIRTDGVTFAFTALDQDLSIGGITYSSVNGFSNTAITTGSSGQVDNLEVVGFMAAGAITQQDLRNGLFNYAQVYVFAVNWQDLTMGICKLRRGWLGETVLSENGVFMAELRGLTQALVQEFGNFYSPLCRADFGDPLCKMPVLPPLWTANTVYAAQSYVRPLSQPDDAHAVAIFQTGNGLTSGASEPTWATTIGATTSDNGGTWTSMPYYRGIGEVVSAIDNRRFVSGPLILPGVATTATNSAIISIRNNVSAGTSLEISDGVNSTVYHTDYDIRGAGEINGIDALHGIYYLLVGGQYGGTLLPPSGLNMTVTISGSSLYLTNNSGHQGFFIKTGDALGALVISPFGTSPLTSSTIVWRTGNNAGAAMELKTYDTTSSTIGLWLGMNFPIQVGDTFFYDAGCDKRRDTCQLKFNNILNFRGEVDMPGLDAVLSYPDL